MRYTNGRLLGLWMRELDYGSTSPITKLYAQSESMRHQSLHRKQSFRDRLVAALVSHRDFSDCRLHP